MCSSGVRLAAHTGRHTPGCHPHPDHRQRHTMRRYRWGQLSAVWRHLDRALTHMEKTIPGVRFFIVSPWPRWRLDRLGGPARGKGPRELRTGPCDVFDEKASPESQASAPCRPSWTPTGADRKDVCGASRLLHRRRCARTAFRSPRRRPRPRSRSPIHCRACQVCRDRVAGLPHRDQAGTLTREDQPRVWRAAARPRPHIGIAGLARGWWRLGRHDRSFRTGHLSREPGSRVHGTAVPAAECG